MAKIIGVVGTRQRDNIKDYLKVRKVFLDYFSEGDTICSGLCPQGADRFAVVFYRSFKKLKKLWFPADWKSHGKMAGLIRNTDIAKNSDLLIACVSKNRKGGTEDTIRKFIQIHGEKRLVIVR